MLFPLYQVAHLLGRVPTVWNNTVSLTVAKTLHFFYDDERSRIVIEGKYEGNNFQVTQSIAGLVDKYWSDDLNEHISNSIPKQLLRKEL